MRRSRRAAAWAVVVTGALLLSGTLNAAPPNAERLRSAADEFDAGRRAYSLKDFENAAVHFENADRDAPSADALVAAIRSRHEAGQLARAAMLAVSGRARYPDDKALADLANRVVPEANTRLHKIVVRCSPECTLVVDERLVPVPVGAQSTLYVDPGTHSLVAGWSGDRHLTRDLVATPGGETEFTLTAPPVTSGQGSTSAADPSRQGGRGDVVPDTTAPQQTGLSPAYFWVGLGATAVLGGITIWSGVDTLQNPGTQKVRDACQEEDLTNCTTLLDQGKAHQSRTNGLLAGTALVGIGTGVIGLLFTDWGGSKKADVGKTLVPFANLGDGLTVGARGRF